MILKNHIMYNHFYCIIMAGGSGTRFWPISRVSRPKQFIKTDETGKSFLRLTYDRYINLIPKENILVVTLENYKHFVKEEIPEIDDKNILLEPYSRNTSPCIAYAMYYLLKKDPEAIMLATPADHIIPEQNLFCETMKNAMNFAQNENILMTIGIMPGRPDCNFGYIQAAGGKNALKNGRPVKVKTFTEKPNKDLASIFFKSGEFLWNTGIYIWKAKVIKKEMEKHLPEITELFRGWEDHIGKTEEKEFIEKAYSECAKISIDYGVMEKTDNAWLYPAKFEWTDIGTWESFHKYYKNKDIDGNSISSKKYMSQENKDSIIISTHKDKLIAVKGLKNYVVVDSDDVLLICPKSDKALKDLTSRLALPEFKQFR